LQQTARGRFQEPLLFDYASVQSDPKGSAEVRAGAMGHVKARLTPVKRKVLKLPSK